MPMDITGYDTVVFSWSAHASFLTSLVLLIKRLWPGLIIDVELLDSNGKIYGLEVESLDALSKERHSIIYFYRDDTMKQHLESYGYNLDLSKEGPFAIHLRKRKKVVFALQNITELTSVENDIGIIEPYPAWLCSPEVLEITLVSPDNPIENGFSKQILAYIIKSCI
jgi:hypothetical protein